MYNVFINLNVNEIIQFETPDVTIEYNEKRMNIAMIVTNQRIIFLRDFNKNTIIETLNITRKFPVQPAFEVVEEISKKDIQHYNYNENGTEIKTHDKNIFIFDYDLTQILDN